jgi:hypothetical protein
VLTIDGHAVVAIEVPESRSAPQFTDPAYKRIGSESVQASREMLDEMIADRMEPVRLLRRFKGKEINYTRFDPTIGSRIRQGGIGTAVLLQVDGQGVVLDMGGGATESAAWGRVSLDPIRADARPLIRIS